MIMYYKRDGTPLETDDVLVWARQFKSEDRRVRQTKLWWGGWLSTVFLGVDYDFMSGGKPQIFESMLFFGDFSDLVCERYATEREAIDGHQKILRAWKFPWRIMLTKMFWSKQLKRIKG